MNIYFNENNLARPVSPNGQESSRVPFDFMANKFFNKTHNIQVKVFYELP